MSRLAQRLLAPGLALAAFALMAALWMAGENGLYVAILRGWGIVPFEFPYLDTAGNLAAWNCARLGEDVIGFDPCDILGRSFNYGPLWQDLTAISLYPRDRVVVGTVLDVVFLASLALLPAAGGWRGAWTMAAAALSTAMVFAVERANPDIVIFLLLLPVGALLARGAAAGLLSWPLVWLAAGLKFYPVALLALALRERPGRFCWIAGLAALLGGAYVLRYHHDLARILPLLPVGNYDSDLFAAKNLPVRLGLVTQAALAPSESAGIAGWLVGAGIVVLLALRGVRHIRRLLRDPDFGSALDGMAERTRLYLLCGALLIGFCFFAGQNIAYRGIFLLFALPGLLAMPGRAVPATLFVMWDGAARHALGQATAAMGLDAGTMFLLGFVYWLFRELVWWWLASVLLAIVLRFVWDSPMRRAVWKAAAV